MDRVPAASAFSNGGYPPRNFPRGRSPPPYGRGRSPPPPPPPPHHHSGYPPRDRSPLPPPPPPGYPSRGRSPGYYRDRSPAPYGGGGYRGGRSPTGYPPRAAFDYRGRSPPPSSGGPFRPEYGGGYQQQQQPRGGYYEDNRPSYGGYGGPPQRRYPPRNYAPNPSVPRGSEEERARSTCLFVGNLPYSLNERDVTNLFERFGRIQAVSMPLDRYTGRHKGFAFVSFEQRVDAEDAMQKYHGYELEGRTLRCDWDVGMGRKEHLSQRDPRNGDGSSPNAALADYNDRNGDSNGRP